MRTPCFHVKLSKKKDKTSFFSVNNQSVTAKNGLLFLTCMTLSGKEEHIRIPVRIEL